MIDLRTAAEAILEELHGWGQPFEIMFADDSTDERMSKMQRNKRRRAYETLRAALTQPAVCRWTLTEHDCGHVRIDCSCGWWADAPGAYRPPDFKFCPYCGKPIEEAESSHAVCRWTLFNNDDPGPRGRLYLTACGRRKMIYEGRPSGDCLCGRRIEEVRGGENEH